MIILLLFLFTFALITLLHIRLRAVIESNRKTLFVGLGRTGVLTNFTESTSSIIIAGRTVKTTVITKKEKPEPIKQKPAKKSTRARPIKDILAIIPDTFLAVSKYFYSILKSLTIEEFEVEINAGFPEPHLTGIAYGYYHAAIAAVPGIGKHFKFVPDWNESSISGGVKTTVSIPLYKIIYSTIVMVFQLPLRKLTKLAIGRKARLERSQKDRKPNDTAK